MPIEAKLEHHLQRLLTDPEAGSARGNRLMGDAQRLWKRVLRLLAMDLVPADIDRPALELTCYALQLPLRHGRLKPTGKLGQISLRDRAEHAAIMTEELLADYAGRELADRAAHLLHEMPQRSTARHEAMLLADAVNLDDFGVTGLFVQAMQLARQQACLAQVDEGFRKRQEYGYWEARLKDGFHFEPVRQIARRRLESARQVAVLLATELKEDHAQ